MKIRALSSVNLNHNQYQNQVSKSKQADHSAPTSNTFELPNYKMSFGMAKLDMNEVYKKSLRERYPFEPNDISFYSPDKLASMCDEMLQNDQQYLKTIFTTKFSVTAHDFHDQIILAHMLPSSKLHVMNQKLLKADDGQALLNQIYTTPSSLKKLPAHYFHKVQSVKEMNSVLDKETLKQIYTTEDVYGETPITKWGYANVGNEHGMFAEVMKQFGSNKEDIKEILSKGNANLIYTTDIIEFIKTFKNDEETLRGYFFVGDNKDKLNYTFFDNLSNIGMKTLHEQLYNNGHSDLLLDIYNGKCENEESFYAVCGFYYKESTAKSIYGLITDPSISPESSLKLLNNYKGLLSSFYSNINTIENILESMPENKREE